MAGKFRERIVGMHYLNRWIVLILDTVASVLCTFLACILADRLVTGGMDVSEVLKITLLSVPASGFSFWLFRIHRNIIRHSTLKELWRLVAAAVLKLVLMAAVVFGIFLPGRQFLIGGLLDILMTTVVLICMRVGMVLGYDVILSRISKSDSNLLIYGVDERSVSLETRMRNSRQYQIVGFYNYGKDYKSYRLANLPVYYFNNEQDFVHIVTRHRIEGILFPDYESIRIEKERLIRYCETHHVRMLIAPPVDEVSGDRLVPGIREIKIEDLLGRDEINMDEEEVASGFRDKTVLVTGAAGSIGSELCRQLAAFGVKRLILFDSAETPTHNIRLELEERFPRLHFVPVIGDVRLKARLRMIFERYRPDVVFHAAAYKHVPLMEENPCEAVFVNAIGTQHVADLCVEYCVEKMVMISTDKAVNPTNVMGASKRLAEIYVQSLGVSIAEGETVGRTRFVTTRFGNVLGSNGSVIPRFMEQIRHGGPVTVTHPEITRFFMTIPEACRLVMEAATISDGNEIMVFEMGESTRIVDLAKRMIELAGYVPGVDIEIKYTGLRPGEKLYEEVLSTMENTIPTSHRKIKIAKVRKYEYGDVLHAFRDLERLAVSVDIHGTVLRMKEIVPEFISRNSPFEAIDAELAGRQGRPAKEFASRELKSDNIRVAAGMGE
ncbi:MAG TPA: polysaccharide biosynthesis protein [Candidatus Tidjanibacter gallistercoris]|nr:polysaccharide biosynthesis protein [Candidatus Tidjanibacter gallistercoris]